MPSDNTVMMSEQDNVPTEREVLALGWLSAELAGRADAWSGNAPKWFPDPPEWLKLWHDGLVATLDERIGSRSAFDAALLAGDRAHLFTIGSPARGLCLRVTLGRLDRHGRWHGRQPDVFLIWQGKRRRFNA